MSEEKVFEAYTAAYCPRCKMITEATIEDYSGYSDIERLRKSVDDEADYEGGAILCDECGFSIAELFREKPAQ